MAAVAPASLSAAPARVVWADGEAAWPVRLLPLRWALSRIQCGQLTVTLPGGRRIEVTGEKPGPTASLQLQRWRPLWRALAEGDLGLAFAYRDGAWDSPDLTALLLFGVAKEAALGGHSRARGPARWAALVLHHARANTRRGSRDNISAHYDLGNAFYERWLDDTMLYSSALYEGLPLTLEAAQQRRLARILGLMDVQAGQRVLEIGCGWGTLAASIARQGGAQVVGVTLSKEQLAFAQARARAWGVSDQVDLRLQDYRDVDGRFDRIVSIEMIEAVGEAYWPVYFDTLRERLAPGGTALLQAITIDEQYFEGYRSSPDFIQRCIFPGGMLPTPERMAAQAKRAGLSFRTELQFGLDYARTLAEWRSRFLDQWPAIEALGFDLQFKRLWTYYLSYCEAGFLTGRINVGLYRLAHDKAD